MRTSTFTAAAAPYPLELLVDEHAKDLVLRVARHVGDLVDVERAAMRLFQRADLAPASRHRLRAEKFDFHPVRRDRGRVDCDERPAGAVRVPVDGSRNQFLAGT